MSRQRMFLRMLRRSVFVQRQRSAIAFIALVVAAAVSTALAMLYVDLQAKLHKEFRSFGANITVAAPEGKSLPSDALPRAESAVGANAAVAPYAFAVATSSDGTQVVVAGAEMARTRKLNSWWSVTAWPSSGGEVLAGKKAARLFDATGNAEFSFQGKQQQLKLAGVLTTGSEEESRIYMPLDQFVAWTGVQPSLLEVAVSGSREDVSAAVAHLLEAFPATDVQPVRNLVETEGAVVQKMHTIIYASTVLISLLVAICVLATLTSSVLERRRDFAVMKALGASQRTVNVLFLSEAALLGAAAALVGAIFGTGAAFWIAYANFAARLSVRPAVYLPVLVGSIALALLSAVLPLARLQHLQPAWILKGE